MDDGDELMEFGASFYGGDGLGGGLDGAPPLPPFPGTNAGGSRYGFLPPPPGAPEEALQNPYINKLLLLANYNTVGCVFLLFFFRTSHHLENVQANHQATGVGSVVARGVLSGLLLGDGVACVCALLRRKELKPHMKTMLLLNAVWEALVFTGGLIGVLLGTTGILSREEVVAAMLWNAFFGSLCLSMQRVSWAA